jgi:hypothetical protein
MAITSLDELELHLRKALPDAKSIERLRRNDDSKFIEFTWHKRHFIVQLNLQAFELKDKTLFFTGASMLIQASLSTKNRNEKTLGTVVDALEKAEEMMRNRREQALSLVESIKATLQRMIVA